MRRVAHLANMMVAALGGLVFLCLLVPNSRAVEPTRIQDILADPSVYHLRQAIMQGTVRRVEPLDPYETPSGTRCYGAYLFQLDDDTGVIDVAVTGICGIPLVKDPDVQENDRVSVDATIYTLSLHDALPI